MKKDIRAILRLSNARTSFLIHSQVKRILLLVYLEARRDLELVRPSSPCSDCVVIPLGGEAFDLAEVLEELHVVHGCAMMCEAR